MVSPENNLDDSSLVFQSYAIPQFSPYLHLFYLMIGDLHPGNILVTRNTAVRGKPLNMHMIDCGLVVEMGENEHA